MPCSPRCPWGGCPQRRSTAAPARTTQADRIIYDPATGLRSYDPDGTGAAAPVQFAELGNGLAVTARDFYVV